jgi:hypothetical protein
MPKTINENQDAEALINEVVKSIPVHIVGTVTGK